MSIHSISDVAKFANLHRDSLETYASKHAGRFNISTICGTLHISTCFVTELVQSFIASGGRRLRPSEI